MDLPKSCNFGRVYGRLTTNGEYRICCGNVPFSGDYQTDGKFIDYWKSDKLNNLLIQLRDNLHGINETWADGNCDNCPHFVMNEKLHKGEIDIPPSPITFNIDVINLCDHRCNFCWWWSYDMIDDKAQYEGWNDWVKERLDLQIFKDTVDGLVELGDCEEIQIGGGGEPLLHPNIQEMIGYVKENNLSCKLITNFCQITEEQLDSLIEVGLDDILINISAGTQETYCETRRVKPKVWDKLLSNIEHILKNRTTGIPKINLKNVINSENIHEVSHMIDLGVTLKVDIVSLRFFQEDGVYKSDSKIISEEQQLQFNKILNEKISEYGYEEYKDDTAFKYNYKSPNVKTLLVGDV